MLHNPLAKDSICTSFSIKYWGCTRSKFWYSSSELALKHTLIQCSLLFLLAWISCSLIAPGRSFDFPVITWLFASISFRNMMLYCHGHVQVLAVQFSWQWSQFDSGTVSAYLFLPSTSFSPVVWTFRLHQLFASPSENFTNLLSIQFHN